MKNKTLKNVFNLASERVYWYRIRVVNGLREDIECLFWNGLRYDLRVKYNWYFKYREALLQVKYPKNEILVFWGYEPAEGKALEEIKKNMIISKKAKITQYKNKLTQAEKSWNSLFPIQDDPAYKKAVEKISRLEFELKALSTEEKEI